MTSLDHDSDNPRLPRARRRQRSLRTQLLVVVTAAMVLGLGVVLLLDYRTQRTARLADRGQALQDEATLVLPLVGELRHHGADAVQRYIDDACARMQDSTSHGHRTYDRAIAITGMTRKYSRLFSALA